MATMIAPVVATREKTGIHGKITFNHKNLRKTFEKRQNSLSFVAATASSRRGRHACALYCLCHRKILLLTQPKTALVTAQARYSSQKFRVRFAYVRP